MVSANRNRREAEKGVKKRRDGCLNLQGKGDVGGGINAGKGR